MFEPKQWKHVENITVKEFCEYLQKNIPGNALLYVCGDNHVYIEVLSSMAEQERLTIRKRQQEGIEAAKQKGKHLGRPKKLLAERFDVVYELWLADKISTKEACLRLNLSRTSFYRYASRCKKK